MHSSRMCTVHCSGHHVSAQGVSTPGGVFQGDASAQGVSAQGGVCQGGAFAQGVSVQGGVYPSMHWV